MSEAERMSQTESTVRRPPTARHWLSDILIGVLTLGICHFAGLCLVTSAFNGIPRRSAFAGAVVCTAAVGVLVWRRNRIAVSPPTERRKSLLMIAVVWSIVLAGLSFVQARSGDAAIAVMLVYPVAACGWLFVAYSAALPGSVRTRFVAATMLLALQAVFPVMFRFAGLTGAGQTMLTWRSRPDASAADAPRLVDSNTTAKPSNVLSPVGNSSNGTASAETVDVMPDDTRKVTAANATASDSQNDSKPDTAVSESAPSALPPSEPTHFAASESHPSPQFMGPNRTGKIATVPINFNWQTNPPRKLWDRTIGAGWGAFAASGELCWTQEQRGEREFVVCYRLLTGEPVWAHSDLERFESSMGGPGPRATPTLHGNSLVTLGGTGLLNCLDAKTGSPRWQRHVLKDNGGGSIAHGVCGSPAVIDETVVVAVTGAGARSIAAYRLDTGEPVWSGGSHAASYSSPAVMEIDGVRQVVLFGEDGVASVEWGTGRDLWFFPWTSETRVNCAQPIVSPSDPHEMVIACAYGKGAVRFRVNSRKRPDGPDGPAAPNGPAPSDTAGSAGSAGSATSWLTTELWQSRNLKTKFTSAVFFEDHLYGLDDGILVCVEWKTGKRAWKAGHYNYGQVILVNDMLLVQTEDGPVAVVQPDPKRHREIAMLPALEGRTWNYPTVAGRWLLVRNDQQAQCWELPNMPKSP